MMLKLRPLSDVIKFFIPDIPTEIRFIPLPPIRTTVIHRTHQKMAANIVYVLTQLVFKAFLTFSFS